ncbi:hypothetical protein CL648_02305 [bacterium]|nr:hypothetical protein [bacterium]
MRILQSIWIWSVMLLGITLHAGMTRITTILWRPSNQRAAWCASTARYFLVAMFWLSRIRVSIRGLSHAIQAQPVLILANHCSHSDIIALMRMMPFHIVFVAKQELFRVPVLAHELHTHGHIAIHRSNPRQSLTVLNSIADQLKLGRSVIVFPEGTRSSDGSLQPFHRAVFSVAFKRKIPVLPVTINGSASVLPKDSVMIQPGALDIVVHDLIQPQAINTVDALMARVRFCIEEGLRPKGI